jgi:hypothetical protein
MTRTGRVVVPALSGRCGVVAADDADSGLRLAELVAAFSLATDLGLGQPMEHVLRSVAGLALVAGVVSVPLGLVLYVGAYHLAGGDGGVTVASWPALTLVPIVTVLVATAVPARVATRTPVAAALRAD